MDKKRFFHTMGYHAWIGPKKGRRLFWLLTPLLILLSIVGCESKSSTTQGVDTRQLDEAFAEARQIGNLKSLVVSHRGAIIKEAFYGTGGANVRHDVRSVTKSVVCLLIGIAIDKGFIGSIEQTLGEFLDASVYTITPEKAAIRIRHLLTMSSGFEWDETTSVDGFNNWIQAPNQVQYLLDKPLVHTPGEYFTYNSAALHLLSVIITRATGLSTLDFAQQYLFGPLDIPLVEWFQDKQGYYNGGAGLQITPHDMVKIGSLVLHDGVYNGNAIVSANYISHLSQSQISTRQSNTFGPGYGYGWWVGFNEQGDYFYANGYGGQFIVVVPNLNLVVVATNTWSGIPAATANQQWRSTLNLIINQILPAFE